jgi:hypothetical protein
LHTTQRRSLARGIPGRANGENKAGVARAASANSRRTYIELTMVAIRKAQNELAHRGVHSQMSCESVGYKVAGMTKDPTKNPEFARVLGNLLSAKPKHHSEMKLGKSKRKKKKSPRNAKKKSG